MIISRTPLRISLVGGGSDMESFYSKHAGAVVSFAISKYVYVSVNNKFDGKLRVSYSKTENVDSVDELQHDLVRETLRLFNLKSGLEITSVSDIPGSGTGLGSSSAFTVGLINTLSKNNSPSILAERAYVVEAKSCGRSVGKQDAYASAHGGINHFTFAKRGVAISKINLPAIWIELLESRSLLLWTGLTRDANDILKVQNKGFQDGGNAEIGKQLAGLANDLHAEMSDGMEMTRLGEFLQQAWKIKKFMAPSISNSKIDRWYETAMENGAYGGKLLGAGGGGFLYFIAPPFLHEQIAEKTGLRKVNFKIEMEGSKIIYES